MYKFRKLTGNLRLLSVIYEIKFDSEEDLINVLEKLDEAKEKIGELICMKPEKLSLFIMRKEFEPEYSKEKFEKYFKNKFRVKEINRYVKEEFRYQESN
ncbi:MAG: hypothetical protein QXS37_01070 [Candidatus Aenigmatarchaeota archaeon]